MFSELSSVFSESCPKVHGSHMLFTWEGWVWQYGILQTRDEQCLVTEYQDSWFAYTNVSFCSHLLIFVLRFCYWLNSCVCVKMIICCDSDKQISRVFCRVKDFQQVKNLQISMTNSLIHVSTTIIYWIIWATYFNLLTGHHQASIGISQRFC